MSDRHFLVESDRAGLRAALVENRRLQAIEIDRTGRTNIVGSITAAKVVRTIPGLGTMVELPDRTQMLLEQGRGKAVPPSGTHLTVQIARAPRGAKLGIATRSVSLAGRGVVHLPLDSGIILSRRLDADTAKRAALETMVAGKPGGWIFRRNVTGLDAGDLLVEIASLEIAGQAAREQVPAVAAPDAFRRLAGDYPAPDRIRAAGLAAQRAVERWCRDFAPSLAGRIEAVEPGLFDLHDLDDAIAAIADSQLPLPGGGSLVIEATEAMTVIDVNAGPETNLIAVNLTAAAEIARQLRLRHIGGIVVIDFISMTRPRDREQVMEALRVAVADDPAQTYIVPMSPLGLVEMTRERRGPGLECDSP